MLNEDVIKGTFVKIPLSAPRVDELRRWSWNNREEDLDQMEALINELLLYARLDKQPSLHKELVKFEPFINEIVNTWSDESCKITFQDEFSQRKVELDKKYFSKVVNNIIQNACKYGNGIIYISIDGENSYSWLRDGPITRLADGNEPDRVIGPAIDEFEAVLNIVKLDLYKENCLNFKTKR